MRKQATNNFAGFNTSQNQFRTGTKNVSAPKNPRYIYTEEDLGEGILDVGISSYYMADQQDSLITKPWTNMLKTTH